VHYATLRSLSQGETRECLEHRTTIAGAVAFPFDAQATETIYEISRGNLRTVDNLALGALEAAARADTKAVSAPHVIEARRHLWP
jgi:type II secretory pathway predicted ATPase ExeA